jgi:uncharacterized membrane protein YhaH (DUF805 family)
MAGTNGGQGGAGGGGAGAYRLRAAAATTTALLIVAAINSLSVGHDRAGEVDFWEPWVWEFTSVVFWIAILLPLWALARRLLPPARPWPVALVAILALAVPISLAHFVWIGASRSLVYLAFGYRYHFDWSSVQLLYEGRKDVLSVAVLVGVGAVIDQLASRRPSVVPAPALPWRLEVRDGSRILWLAPEEIERAEAAGNYVELHTANGTQLHRTTLAALEAELAPHGFARIHRSRLVRRAAVTAVTTTPSGDFEARLASGVTVAGSRRFRSELRN